MSMPVVYSNTPGNVQYHAQEGDRTGAPLAEMQARRVSLPADLTKQKIFCVFVLVPQPPKADGTPVKDKKIPYQAAAWLRGKRVKAESDNPATFSTFTEAVNCVRSGKGDAIGFKVPDGYTLIDKDDVIVDGVINPDGLAFIDQFRGTHTHVSMSGSGLHALCKGEIPKARKLPEIELYCGSTTNRFCAVPVDPVGFSGNEIMDCQSVLDDLWARYGVPDRPTAPAMPVSVSHDVKGVLEKIAKDPKYAALLSGDTSCYSSPSDARWALAGRARFFKLGESDIADVLLRSNLFKKEDNERERKRKAALDAANMCKTFTGPFYDPSHGYRQGVSIVLPTGAPVLDTPDATDMPADVEGMQAEIANHRAQLAEYQRMFTDMQNILASPEYEAGAKLTVLGLYIEGVYQKERKRQQTPHGYHIPAGWIGKRVGLKTATVNNNLNKLQLMGVVDRTVRSEEITTVETETDMDTGEMTEVRGKRRGKRTYIKLPDNMVDFAKHAAAYRKPENTEKRGGIRIVCNDHPTAGTVTSHVTRCAECGEVLDTKHTHHLPPAGDHVVESIEGKTRTIRPTTPDNDDYPPVVNGDDKRVHDPRLPATHDSVFTYHAPAAKPAYDPTKCINCGAPVVPGSHYCAGCSDPRTVQSATPGVPTCSRRTHTVNGWQNCTQPTMHHELGYGSNFLCAGHSDETKEVVA